MLGIPAPVSPDGDPLTITINALPRGTVRNGTAILHPGDHVTPEELSKLTFWPEAGFTGPAGSLRYTRGQRTRRDRSKGRLTSRSEHRPANDASAEAGIVGEIRGSSDPEGV